MFEQREDRALRPQMLDGYVGQSKIKDNMKVFMGAAKERGEPLDHVLLYGPPGLGKTTLAHIIANEMGTAIKCTSGPAIEKPGDLAALVTSLEHGDVLFIDEIHRLPITSEEILYSALEDFKIDILLGEGVDARTITLELPRFTLVGATTRTGLISSPLRDRFQIISRLEYYSEAELAGLVERNAGLLNIPIDKDGAAELASRSRGTPRIANRLLRRVRDFAEVKGDGRVTTELASMALGAMEVDNAGLDLMDTMVLKTIVEKFRGGPVGLDTLAAAVGEEKGTLEDVVEPFLIKKGFLNRTPRGRVATESGLAHLGYSSESASPGPLFT